FGLSRPKKPIGTMSEDSSASIVASLRFNIPPPDDVCEKHLEFENRQPPITSYAAARPRKYANCDPLFPARARPPAMPQDAPLQNAGPAPADRATFPLCV